MSEVAFPKAPSSSALPPSRHTSPAPPPSHPTSSSTTISSTLPPRQSGIINNTTISAAAATSNTITITSTSTSTSTANVVVVSERTSSPVHSIAAADRSQSSAPSHIPSSNTGPEPALPQERLSNMQRFGKIQYESSSLDGSASLPGTSISAPAGSLTLLSSADSYISPPPSSFLNNTTTLEDLAKLIKLQAYKRHKQAQCRIKLHRSLVSTALHSRFIRVAGFGHTLLVEHLKADQKKEFAQLYNAILDVRLSCEHYRRHAMMEKDFDPAKDKEAKEDDEKPKEVVSFLHETPMAARDTILSFLSMIRSSPTFLANRLSKLSQSDLDALARIHNPIDSSESVLSQASVRAGRSSASSVRSNAQQSINPVENLLSFRRNDAMHIMIHSLFANPNNPDSAEEKMRIEVWSTACARLLADVNSKKSDQFLYAVLDTWATMREWPALSNLETCLMTLLQEGAFMLNSEEQGVRVQVNMDSKTTIAVEEFHAKGVKMLFEVFDDEPGAGGIPDSVLKLGNAILEKIDDPKRKRNAEFFLLVKWFFSHFLKEAIQYPEHFGIMVGHHISEHARLKILRPLVSKMMKAAYNVLGTFDLKQNPVEPALRVHIENLLERFRRSRPVEAGPLLLSTKNSVASKEGTNVQGFVAVCAADIITLYNALYPKAPAHISNPQDINSKRNPMSSSISSRSFAKSPQSSAFDMASLLSRSSSSITSEGASAYMPLLDRSSTSIPEDRVAFSPGGSTQIASPTPTPSLPAAPLDHSDNFGVELKNALDLMSNRLPDVALTGGTHPCAEDWAILFVSPDGKELSLRTKSEWADDEEEDDEGNEASDSDDEDPMEMSAMDREYHALKHAILKLVEEYEIPEDLNDEDAAAKIRRTNDAPTITFSSSTPPDEFSHLDPSNPYRASNLTAMITADKKKDERLKKLHAQATGESVKHEGALLTMLQAATRQCLARGEYVSAHQYHRALTQLRKLTPSLARDGFSPLMHIFSRGARVAIDRSDRLIKEADSWFVWLSLTQERHDALINDAVRTMKNLRDKMWYVTDVRNSAAYEEAKGVAMALKKMGQPVLKGAPVKPMSGKSNRSLAHRTSQLSLLKSEGFMEVIAASPELGGPNKLNDEQAEKTATYLQKFSVENFCKGEERIHRFCCEIDICVNKLVGDGILDGPVLWSSELYARDQRELSSNRPKGEYFLTGLGIPTDDGYETDQSQSSWKNAGHSLLRKSSTSNILTLASQGRSHSSSVADLAASRRSRSKSNASDLDPFGLPSPSLHNGESFQAFWSPFGSAPTTIVVPAAQRPKTSQSASSAPAKNEVSTHEKRKFLAELKQSLTGLLLSDLGVEVWYKGSETDAWFSSSYVDDCIARKQEQEEEARRMYEAKLAKAGRKSMRRKSTKNLRKSVHSDGEYSTGLKPSLTGNSEPTLSCEESTASDATSRSIKSNATSATNKTAVGKKSDIAVPFPYKKAFKELLKKFSAHPNPFEKLHILHDLEKLIISSLNASSPQLPVLCFSNKRASLPPSPLLAPQGDASRVSSLQLPEAQNVEQMMVNIDKRRSHAVGSHVKDKDPISRSGTPTARPRSPQQSIPNTDKIVEVLQELFRQADIRPATLFRDLQYVAAFVPASILDFTEVGKAFWDTGLAALGLKQDVQKYMVEIADEIVSYRTSQRNSSDRGKNLEDSTFHDRYDLGDAGKMYMITAKEGNPVAQRELAIFYLTHPTLLPKITKPLSRPRDVYRPNLMVAKGDDPDKRDPATMCTAYHWMELSSEGGDSLAKQYIRQRDEAEA